MSQRTHRAARVPRGEARRRILDAAAVLLRDMRYRDLTVDAVMTQAGLARTVFYRHFDGLGDLLLALLPEFREALLGGGDPADPDFTRRVLASAVDVAVRHGSILRALDDAARHDEEVERAYREFVEWSIDTTTEMIEAVIASGDLPPVDNLREVTRALTIMNGQYLIDTLGRDPDADPEVVLEVLTTIWYATFQR